MNKDIDKKLKVGILGATGIVGQRFVLLLANHPWFAIKILAASPSSKGKSYEEAVKGRWHMTEGIPEHVKKMPVFAVFEDREAIAKEVDFVFCALDLDKKNIQEIEAAFAFLDIPVVSNNSANRWEDDVPMIIPEINMDHLQMIEIQRKKRGYKKGFITVKPNCSIQSYVAILTALKEFDPVKIDVVSLQAISGAGKTFDTWPEMIDNINPQILGEEEKSEKEPLKIWGKIAGEKIVHVQKPEITVTCIRVPVTDGHLARVRVKFGKKVTKEQIIEKIKTFDNPLKDLDLPSAPSPFIKYFEEVDRPQTRLDRDYENGMGVTMGRLEEDHGDFDFRFISLAHNTLRGAAGGAVLTAELLVKKGYIT